MTARPLTAAIGHTLVAQTLAQLGKDLRAAATEPHPYALRTGAIEIALARLVGAMGGPEAETALGRQLGWSRLHNFGALARTCAEVGTPAAPPPPTEAAMDALLGLIECRHAVRQLAGLQAELDTQASDWTEAQRAQLDRLSALVHVTGPQRWEAAVRLAASQLEATASEGAP